MDLLKIAIKSLKNAHFTRFKGGERMKRGKMRFIVRGDLE